MNGSDGTLLSCCSDIMYTSSNESQKFKGISDPEIRLFLIRKIHIRYFL